MPDLSRFTALAVKNGAVPPVPPAATGGGTAGGIEIINQSQYDSVLVPPVPPVPPQNNVTVLESDLIDAFEERAAIMEYDGCLSREDAEAEARADVFGGGASAM